MYMIYIDMLTGIIFSLDILGEFLIIYYDLPNGGILVINITKIRIKSNTYKSKILI